MVLHDENGIDINKIDEAVLALLYLTMHKDGVNVRAWKNIDWDAMNRLYEKGYIMNPRNKAKSVVVTDEGEDKARAMFNELFCK